MYHWLCKKIFGSDTPKLVFHRGGGIHPPRATQGIPTPGPIGLMQMSCSAPISLYFQTCYHFALSYKFLEKYKYNKLLFCWILFQTKWTSRAPPLLLTLLKSLMVNTALTTPVRRSQSSPSVIETTWKTLVQTNLYIIWSFQVMHILLLWPRETQCCCPSTWLFQVMMECGKVKAMVEGWKCCR